MTPSPNDAGAEALLARIQETLQFAYSAKPNEWFNWKDNDGFTIEKARGFLMRIRPFESQACQTEIDHEIFQPLVGTASEGEMWKEIEVEGRRLYIEQHRSEYTALGIEVRSGNPQPTSIEAFNKRVDRAGLEAVVAAAVREKEEEIEQLKKRRGGECQKCGSWVCPPLTCFSCLSSAPDELRQINQTLTLQIEEKDERIKVLEDALKFYADPDTYFAIGIFPDRPCGEFIEDFSEVKDCHGFDTVKPGKRARAALTSTNPTSKP